MHHTCHDLLDRKVTALAAMASQTAGSIALLGEELFAELVAEECFVDAAPFTADGVPPGNER